MECVCATDFIFRFLGVCEVIVLRPVGPKTQRCKRLKSHVLGKSYLLGSLISNIIFVTILGVIVIIMIIICTVVVTIKVGGKRSLGNRRPQEGP